MRRRGIKDQGSGWGRFGFAFFIPFAAVAALACSAFGGDVESDIGRTQQQLTFSCLNDDKGDEICCTDGRKCFYMKEGAGACTGTRDAQSYAQAVGTLEDVEQCIEQYVDDEGGSISEHIEVRIKKGTYHEQVEWSYYTPGYYTFFIPADYKYGGWGSFDKRPVFDGEHSRSYMMNFLKGPGSATGEFTRLAFYYLDIRNYLNEGIIIYLRSGSCDGALSTSRWSGYNYFYGNYFYNIGRVKLSILSSVEGQAGIFLCSSNYNTIKNNHFVNLINLPPSDPLAIHAVYIKTNSSNNLIRDNVMTNISGAPIRIRDNSNDNDIRANVLTNTGGVGYGQMEEHYLEDPNVSPAYECAAHAPTNQGECPSWRNWFRYNSVGCGYGSSLDVAYWYYWGKEEDSQAERAACIPTECPDYSPDSRLQTASNTDNCP